MPSGGSNKIAGDLCTTPGCDRLRRTTDRGRMKYCTTHVGNHWGAKKGRSLIGKSWIGNNGYRYVYWASKQLLVHRLVEFISHGPIPQGIDVHHRDGNTLNNYDGNLQRIERTAHNRLSAQTRWGVPYAISKPA